MPYDTGGNYYNDKPLTHCQYCGKKLELTNEINTCSECQKNQPVKEIKMDKKETNYEFHLTFDNDKEAELFFYIVSQGCLNSKITPEDYPQECLDSLNKKLKTAFVKEK